MSERVFIKTFGCQMNEYDSNKMADVLAESHQAVRADDPADASILLLNTCSVREKAQEKVFSLLGQWRELKELDPRVVIGVGGCVASQEGEHIRERAPFVDLVFGPQTLHRLPQMLNQVRDQRRPAMDISFPEIEKFDALPAPRKDGPTAFVSVMEGCSKYCTFCVVPYTRGEEISRPFDDVLEEVRSLATQGVCEVTLLGQNVNGYQGAMDDGTQADLGLLIHYVAEIEGIERIRYTTSHPNDMHDSLFDAYHDVPALVSHIHLPVQSGSDRILKLMKRNHKIDSYRDSIYRLREARPEISISSDFIVGFPGETEADFEATMALVREIGFDRSFSFVYSPRPGTPAASAVDDVPLEEKKQRLYALQALLKDNDERLSAAMLHSVQTVLVERRARRGETLMAGRTANNRVVNFEAGRDLLGKLVDVRITEARPNSMLGELV